MLAGKSSREASCGCNDESNPVTAKSRILRMDGEHKCSREGKSRGVGGILESNGMWVEGVTSFLFGAVGEDQQTIGCELG